MRYIAVLIWLLLAGEAVACVSVGKACQEARWQLSLKPDAGLVTSNQAATQYTPEGAEKRWRVRVDYQTGSNSRIGVELKPQDGVKAKVEYNLDF